MTDTAGTQGAQQRGSSGRGWLVVVLIVALVIGGFLWKQHQDQAEKDKLACQFSNSISLDNGGGGTDCD